MMDTCIFFPKNRSMECCYGKILWYFFPKVWEMLAEQNQTGFSIGKPYRALDLVFCITPFQEGFPNLGGPRTMILCAILGPAFHKTHTGEPWTGCISCT